MTFVVIIARLKFTMFFKKKGGHGFALHRCPWCISDILPLTFRVKYFKPKKIFKGRLNIVGIFTVLLNALASPQMCPPPFFSCFS